MTPEINLQIQNTVVNLYGPKRVKTLESLINGDENSKELLNHAPIRHAISYNIYYGDPESKELAITLASKISILTEGEIQELNS